MKDKIEIPFGAHDSELKGWEYTIPEGMEAIIKDGKVIVREKENEDERIMKWMINQLSAVINTESAKEFDPTGYEMAIKALSWLEKQKKLFESGRGLYYYDGEKTTYCGYPATEENSYDFTTSQQEKQKESPITANDLDEEIHRFFDDCIDVHEAKLYGSISERVIPVDCYELTARHFAKWGEKQKEQNSLYASGTAEPDYGICDDYISATLLLAMARHGWYACHVGEEEGDVLQRKKYVERTWPAYKDNLTQEQKPSEDVETIVMSPYEAEFCQKFCDHAPDHYSPDGWKLIKNYYAEFKEIVMRELAEQKPAEVKDPFSNANFVRGYESGYADAKREQKPAEWSPTKEQMVALSWAANGMLDNDSPSAGDIKANLRSLYNDLQSKSIKPAEWSDEDEKAYQLLLNEYKQMYEGRATSITRKEVVMVYNFLKSLRPSWKPSEEQMEALNTVLEHEAERIGSSKELEKANALYEQIKKLI